MKKHLVGEITHVFDKINVAVVNMQDNVKIGDKISIEGTVTNFVQTVGSMQIDKHDIQEAHPGDDIGMKIDNKVRKGDKVYIIKE